jgi:hypothetical protein
MFGRVDLCDFVLEHPTVSSFVLEFDVVSVVEERGVNKKRI